MLPELLRRGGWVRFMLNQGCCATELLSSPLYHCSPMSPKTTTYCRHFVTNLPKMSFVKPIPILKSFGSFLTICIAWQVWLSNAMQVQKVMADYTNLFMRIAEWGNWRRSSGRRSSSSPRWHRRKRRRSPPKPTQRPSRPWRPSSGSVEASPWKGKVLVLSGRYAGDVIFT